MTEEKKKSPVGSSSTSNSIAAMQVAAAEFLRGKPHWVVGMYIGAKRFFYVAIPVLIWCVCLIFEDSLPEKLVFGMTIVITVVLFLLSLPVSLIQRADLILSQVLSFSGDSKPLALIVLLVYVLINFLVIGAIRGLLKSLRGR